MSACYYLVFMITSLPAVKAAGFTSQVACHNVGSDAHCDVPVETKGLGLVQRSVSSHFGMSALATAERSRVRARRGELDIYLLSLSGIVPNQTDYENWQSRLSAHLESKNMTATEGSTADPVAHEEVQRYSEFAKSAGPTKTVCETGFNAGNSALLFLTQSHARLYEFDMGEHVYSQEAANFLGTSFPGRLKVSWGNSIKTLPAFKKESPEVRCDIIIIDGGHSFEVAQADLTNFAPLAAAENIVVIDDTPCVSDWCQGPSQAWAEAKRTGVITETESHSMGAGRGFSVGKYNPVQSFD